MCVCVWRFVTWPFRTVIVIVLRKCPPCLSYCDISQMTADLKLILISKNRYFIICFLLFRYSPSHLEYFILYFSSFWWSNKRVEWMWRHNDAIWQLFPLWFCQMTSSWRHIRTVCSINSGCFGSCTLITIILDPWYKLYSNKWCPQQRRDILKQDYVETGVVN